MDHATNGVVGQRGPTSGVPLLAVASLDALSFPGRIFNHLSDLLATQAGYLVMQDKFCPPLRIFCINNKRARMGLIN